jgi:dihydroxy-acid dehydratase
MRSDSVKKGVERAPHRSLSMHSDVPAVISTSICRIINSYNTSSRHMHLDSLPSVQDGVRAAGGVAFEINTIGVCDASR